MLFSTIGQIYVFLWMTAAGAVIGLWYALLAALRRLLRAGFWLSLASDAAFGAGAAVVFCAALYTANYGRLRLYAALGAVLGFAVSSVAFWLPARRFGRKIVTKICRITQKMRSFRWIKVIFR